MGVVAPYILQEGSSTAYVSLDEVKFSPTASAVDFSNLVANGSQAVQDRALYELIDRASSMADVFVYGRLGTLSATVNTENGRYRPNRMGQFIISPNYTPILEVQSFSVGTLPGVGLTATTLSNNNCFIERDQFIVTAASGLSNVTTTYGSLSTVGAGWNYDQQCFCQWTYVNGFANTFLTANASAGSTTLSVTSTTGIYTGTQMTIWDGMNDEDVTIASVGTNTVTLTSTTKYAHGPNTNISTLPPAVKQAVIHIVVGLIKERGQGGLVLSEMGEVAGASPRAGLGMDDILMGYDLLEPFKAIWGRS